MGSARHRNPSPASGAVLILPLMLGYAVVLVGAVVGQRAPSWVLGAALGLNLAAFLAYWIDKQAAGSGRSRIPESTLHFWSLAGGWPGAWVAQQVLRHKTVKQPFQSVYRATVVLNVISIPAALWWWGYRPM